MSISSSHYAQAMNLLADARILEKDKSKKPACLDMYTRALQILATAMKEEQKEESRGQIKALLAEYLSRAEVIKFELLHEQGQPIPPELRKSVVEYLQKQEAAKTQEDLQGSDRTQQPTTTMMTDRKRPTATLSRPTTTGVRYPPCPTGGLPHMNAIPSNAEFKHASANRPLPPPKLSTPAAPVPLVSSSRPRPTNPRAIGSATGIAGNAAARPPPRQVGCTTSITTTPRRQPAPPRTATHDNPLASIPQDLVDTILSDKIDPGQSQCSLDDIIGHATAKRVLLETVVLPLKQPELFTGLRKADCGILLYGPPGNGKTMLAKAMANISGCTFFSISSATVTSKNYGEGEKLVRALFAVARAYAPSIIFLDEADSILGQRGGSNIGGEHEASRRLKTEFMIQMEGLVAGGNDETKSSNRVVVICATNLPQDLDGAILRRLPRQVYIGNPNAEDRRAILEYLLQKNPQGYQLTSRDWAWLLQKTERYSNSDLTALCRESSMGPLRRATNVNSLLYGANKENFSGTNLTPITRQDFEAALMVVRPSLTPQALERYTEWQREQGNM